MSRTAFHTNRRALMAGALAAASFAPSSFAKEKRWRGMKDAILINALGGFFNPNTPPYTDEQRAAHYLNPRGIDDAIASGLAATNLTLGYVYGDEEPFEATVKDIAWFDEAIRLRPGKLMKAYSVDDIRAAKKQNRLGVIYGFQNCAMLGDDAGRVDIFADLGVRVFQLTYNIRNQLGDGSMAEENKGLTEFGREAVAKLNARNVLVDLSHAGEQTTLDAIEASAAPIAITHTGCAALAPHPRNKTDAELRALAEKGGVAGIYFMPYLTPGRQHMAEDIVLHIEHAVDVCGEDHVGIGADQSVTGIDDMEGYRKRHREDVENRKRLGIGAPNEDPDILLAVPDLQGVEQFQTIADRLLARGHSPRRIEKILGGNFLRLFAEVW
ncbi:dipeptidase [Hyphococcus luteus]|uniref:Peptidase M19 n=1 Tax=Hyphococcus luteus TaxID=2058213 RepID=A0A2S7K8C9_9PROT|nr:membrane dipeptidase [Marinicaulis flavus]PQA88750.1 peptidase M19 [Marinicaulis flavus]